MTAQIKDNFSLGRLFATKEPIEIYIEDKVIKVRPISVRDMYTHSEEIGMLHLLMSPLSRIKKTFLPTAEHPLDFITTIIKHGLFSEYRALYSQILHTFAYVFYEMDTYDLSNSTFALSGVTITKEIWDYILYVLKLICGEKTTKPLVFENEEARKFYEAQQKTEERIRAIRAKAQENDSSQAQENFIMKLLLRITYSFPSLTIDYLLDQTMAQILWLHTYAAGAVSYEVNAQAFAAGNMKKGSKLDFFIE